MLRTGYFAVAGAALAAPPDIEYVRRWANSTNGTLYTSTSGSLGRAVDRLVVVVVNGTINGGGANSGITGGTIGGVTATVHRGQVDTPTGTAYAQTDFLVARLPASNVSGTVSITYAGLHSSCVMNIYDIVGDANPFPTVYQGAGNAASKNVALASHKAAAAIGGGSSMAVTINSWTIASSGKPVIKDDEATIRSNGSCAMHMLDASGAPTITFTPASAGAQLAAAVAVFSVPPNAPADVLLVGGGGGGSGSTGNGGGGAGGGGAGGVFEAFNQSIWKDAPIPLSVGGGGQGGLSLSSVGDNGGDTSLGNLAVLGGGGGAGYLGVPRAGGSGGAGAYTVNGAAGTAGQGNRGGNGSGGNDGGGGGGAGQAGANATSAPLASGKGGDGVLSVLLNEYVGGGGGGGSYTGANGAGGLGGGGDGGWQYLPLPTDGAPNTGGGGGGRSGGQGGGSTGYRGANGGSGVAVVRVPLTRWIDVGAGLTYTMTEDATHRTYKFTAGSGNITVKDAVASAFSINLEGMYENGANLGAYTYANAPLGAPAFDRGIIVAATVGGQSQSIGSVTLGGQPMQELANFPTGNWGSGLYYLPYPGGDTADVVVNVAGGTGYSVGINVISVYGHDPATMDFNSVYVPSGTSAGFPLDIPANGKALYFNVLNGSRLSNWQPDMAEFFNENGIGDSSGAQSAAVKTATAALPGHVETVGVITDATQIHYMGVAWGPK